MGTRFLLRTTRDMDLDRELVSALAGRYDIERELGRGGMAAVYLARDRKHGREVAIKVILPELASAVGAERFLREVAIAAPLVHPNILPIYDSGEAAGQLYYVMPYVDGLTLRQRLDRETQLPIDDALSIARQVAAALDYAHAHGVVHRDIKPDNILLHGEHAIVADFGLARAVTSATSAPLTQGLVLGTPAYMSPEQCTPGRPADARSDIYSLACVLFEMIAGEPPFRGATAEVVMAHHLTTPPPSLCAERSSCPRHLDEAVTRALAKVPADRFRTAGEFMQAIDASAGDAPVARTVATPRRTRRIALAAAAALAIGMLGWLGSRAATLRLPFLATPGVDTTRIALLPLDGAPAGGAQEELLYEAFARWQGVNLVDPFQVADAVRQHGRIATEDDALAIARALGAGRYVRGRMVQMGPTTSVRAGLYQVGQREPLEMATVRLAPAGAAASAYQFLADSLLLRGATVDEPPSPGARRSLAAVRAFAAGQRALDDWDLARADSAFDAARLADPGYARAQLWLAQVRAWRRMGSDTWREAAERAMASGSALADRDRALARALVLLASGQPAHACREYDDLRTLNPRDFAAWYGLGQCRTFDRVVVPDAASPSGWRFRSSWGAGLRAYEQALELLPSAHRGFRGAAFESVRELLLTDRDRLVSGTSAGPDSARFLGRLSMTGDSLTLVPYPWQVITGGTPVYPPGFERAVARQREAFRSVASAWASAFPEAGAAKEALALSLEMLGDASAADTLRVARRLTTDSLERLQLAVAEVFVRVKFAMPTGLAELHRAERLGDSLVAGGAMPAAEGARDMASVAELLGRCERAVALARTGAVAITSPMAVPRHYVADAEELRIRATLGCPRASGLTIVSLFNRLEGDPALGDGRRMAQEILLVSATKLSFPHDAPAVALLGAHGNNPMLAVMQLTRQGDTRGARAALARLQAARGATPPPLEAALPEARVMLALGDSTGARDLLRRALGAVATGEPRALALPGRPGALVRAAGELAALEHALGNDAGATPLAAAVRILWHDADLLPRSTLGLTPTLAAR